jgi:hypothetical protein
MTTTETRHPAVTAWLHHLEHLGDDNPNCQCLAGQRTPAAIRRAVKTVDDHRASRC